MRNPLPLLTLCPVTIRRPPYCQKSTYYSLHCPPRTRHFWFSINTCAQTWLSFLSVASTHHQKRKRQETWGSHEVAAEAEGASGADRRSAGPAGAVDGCEAVAAESGAATERRWMRCAALLSASAAVPPACMAACGAGTGRRCCAACTRSSGEGLSKVKRGGAPG